MNENGNSHNEKKEPKKFRLTPPHNKEESEHMPYKHMDTEGVKGRVGYNIIGSESPIQRIIREKKEAEAEGRDYRLTQEQLIAARQKVDFPIEDAKSIGQRTAILVRRECTGEADEDLLHEGEPPQGRAGPKNNLLAPEPYGNWKVYVNPKKKNQKFLPPVEGGAKSPVEKVKEVGRKVKSFFTHEGASPSEQNSSAPGITGNTSKDPVE